MSEEKNEQQRLILAYKAVFGTSDQRTVYQDMVWRDLNRRNGVDLPAFRKDENGAYDPLRAALTDGMRQSFLNIRKMVSADVEKLEKPNAKRK